MAGKEVGSWGLKDTGYEVHLLIESTKMASLGEFSERTVIRLSPDLGPPSTGAFLKALDPDGRPGSVGEGVPVLL